MQLLGGVCYAAIVYMTWADVQGYRMFGVRGLLLVDGLAAVATAIPLLSVAAMRARKNRAVLDTLVVPAEEV